MAIPDIKIRTQRGFTTPRGNKTVDSAICGKCGIFVPKEEIKGGVCNKCWTRKAIHYAGSK